MNSYYFKLHRSYSIHLICQMLAKFSRAKSVRTVSKFNKRKRKFCVVFTYSLKQACEIRKFYVTVKSYKMDKKKWWTFKSCCFAYINLLLFCPSGCRRRRCCLSSLSLSSRNFATMAMWLYEYKIKRKSYED